MIVFYSMRENRPKFRSFSIASWFGYRSSKFGDLSKNIEQCLTDKVQDLMFELISNFYCTHQLVNWIRSKIKEFLSFLQYFSESQILFPNQLQRSQLQNMQRFVSFYHLHLEHSLNQKLYYTFHRVYEKDDGSKTDIIQIKDWWNLCTYYCTGAKIDNTKLCNVCYKYVFPR